MKKLIYIDSCLRDGSRTRIIAERLIRELSERYEIEKVCLDDSTYPVVGNAILIDRSEGRVPETHAALARRIADADRIVIAAPFWDMSFPSALKVFFENMSLYGITFESNEKECTGLCKAEKVLYITTRGMDIATGDGLEQATPYIKALSHLWGLGPLSVIAAQNMDYSSPDEVQAKIETAIKEGLELCRNF